MIERFFVNTYRFFSRRRFLFWCVFLSTAALLVWGALTIVLEENITRFFPEDERAEKLNFLFTNSSFAERLVVMVSVKDSAVKVPADTLTAVAERFSMRLESALAPYGTEVRTRVGDEEIQTIFKTIQENLPVFLTEQDYAVFDSITRPEETRKVLQHHYQQLISPSGLVLKNMIVKDPMGFSFLVLGKLQKLQYDNNFEIYDGYIITKDHRHLVFFIAPPNPANETGKNRDFIDALNNAVSDHHDNDQITVSFFGSAAVAVGNAQQLRADTILSLSLLAVLLTVFIVGFFRDWKPLLLIFVPVLFGALFSLTIINLLKGSVSILAIAAGAVILGIAVNYALHFLVHLRYHHDKEEVIKDLVRPMTLGSLTTVLAFFSLQFTNAAVLKDIGLFAGFSLVGAAVCSLIFLPHLTGPIRFSEPPTRTFPFLKKTHTRAWIIFILLVTPVLFFFAGRVTFNSDMNRLNFMTDETREAQRRIETISPASLQTMYVACDGSTLEEALQKNETISPVIDSLTSRGRIRRYLSPSSLLPSNAMQQQRIRQWKNFWNAERKAAFFGTLAEEGARLKFSPVILRNADSLVNRKYNVMDSAAFDRLQTAFFKDNIIRKNGYAMVVSLINVLPEDRAAVQQSFAGMPANLIDRQMITKLFIGFIHDDFNFIVTSTSLLVFVVLLLSIGRIELTVITFIPMLITWIWILGIMAIVGIEFNIVNVMISTFIFGLGDDFSIFVMDSLQEEYKTGKKLLPSTRISITLSALTTISGLGVLIFAQHPALQSIAAIAIIGVICVFIMSQTLEPYLFLLLITNRVNRGLRPMTANGMFFTAVTYGLFVAGSFFMTAMSVVLRIIPFGKKTVRYVSHRLICFFTGLVLKAGRTIRTKFINEGTDLFTRPGVIIANHSSFLDILLTASLYPRVVLLTNEWVRNSPVFGAVVRFADYYPVTEGAANSIGKLKELTDQGYSVVVFPEGTRSATGRIGRFHKGAFYIAEALHLPVYPLLIHGASEAIPKSTIYLNNAIITLKALPAIEPGDTTYGISYSERAKNISRFFKEAHARFGRSLQTPQSVKYKLFSNYLYKGPVLEWYFKIKLRLEDYYAVFHALIPPSATVLDLGCGYGFLCYSLHLVSGTRTITGVDYDENKIAIANRCYSRSDRVNFHTADMVAFDFPEHDIIILADVLHYLRPEEQTALLVKCFRSLTPGGKIIVRDGDADLTTRHSGTRLTELFSVKLLGFNKAQHELNYISGNALRTLAAAHGFRVETVQEGKFTSNIIFVITRQNESTGAL